MVSHVVWKTWPSGLSNDKNLGLRPRFLSTESLGPCFSHGMGDHDQILQHNTGNNPSSQSLQTKNTGWKHHIPFLQFFYLFSSVQLFLHHKNIKDKFKFPNSPPGSNKCSVAGVWHGWNVRYLLIGSHNRTSELQRGAINGNPQVKGPCSL